MSCYFASMPASNSTVLCIGGITRSEAESARHDGLDVDGRGYYLFLAREDAPTEPIQILAKFFSSLEAERAARVFHVRTLQL
jgi:hypothetical protein